MFKPLHATEFSKHNRFFVSKEIKHDKFNLTIKRFVMLSCGATIKGQPLYDEYYIDIIDYIDGSNNNCITHGKLSFNLSHDDELVKYYEVNYQELDKSFEDTFIMMYNTVESINTLKNSIYIISDNLEYDLKNR